MKIIEEFNTADGALIECSCGIKQYLYFGSEKECSCGRTHEVKVKIVETKAKSPLVEKED